MASLLNAAAEKDAAPEPKERSLLNRAPQTEADPQDYSDRYNTPLSAEQEAAFQAWGKSQAAADPRGRNPAADVYDYDMRGFWASDGKFSDENGHAGDEFKKPNHPSFSDQSRYHGVDGHEGGVWGGGKDGQPWTFTPGRTNLQMRSAPELLRYFQDREPGNRVLLPEGTAYLTS